MGDYLFAKAFRIMVEPESVELMRAISRATERISVGELRQIEETGNYSLSEEEYLAIIADKTASLFNVSCEVGPILGNSGKRERQKFAQFGEKIGIAFQIADDLLDFTGDPAVTGKEPGNDVITGKVTLPLIYALKKVGKDTQKEIISYLQDNKESINFEKIYKFVRENGGIEYAYQRAHQIGEEGLEAVSSLEISEYRDCLVNMVQFTIARAT